MNTHTPGPWTYDRRSRFIGTSDGIIVKLVSSAGQAGIGKNIIESEQQANARLIAAAPELLEALKEAEQRIMALSPSGYVAPELWIISQALAKAEGRQS